MWITVSFWMKKLTEVLIRSFLKTQVPYVIQIEAHKTKKNKNFKPHVPKISLTFFFFFFFLPFIPKHPFLSFSHLRLSSSSSLSCSIFVSQFLNLSLLSSLSRSLSVLD
jgi:hypothetical protein